MASKNGVRRVAIGGLMLSCGLSVTVQAQVIPDQTLGPESSQVFSTQIDGRVTEVIRGGAVRGELVLHSFEQFSIPAQTEAIFQIDPAIQSIIGRVTGGQISALEGILSAQGQADVVLINPNGVLIGAEAQLNIGGSFLVSTADSLIFSEGLEFSAVDPQPVPLLQITSPLGLQFGTDPQGIEVQGSEDLSFQVLPDQRLALVGGEVRLDQGELRAPGGGIDLGAVAPGGVVDLEAEPEGWSLGYGTEDLGGLVQISGAARVDASGEAGGVIQIVGQQIRILEDSELQSDTEGSGSGQPIRLQALEQVELSGDNTAILGASLGTGSAGGVEIEAAQVILGDGAFIATPALDQGRGGDIQIQASESVQMSGISSDGQFPTQIGSQVFPSGSGQAGDIVLETPVLMVADGGQISASTFGAGQAGSLQVTADRILLEGTTPDGQVSSGLFSQVNPQATGAGGEIQIETGELIVLGGAQVSTSNRTGFQGGTLTITARERVQISGASETADLLLGSSGLFVSAEVGSTGAGGALILTTPELVVEQGGKISADTFGSGQGGTATLRVDRLIVQTGGQIRAGTFAEGDGGELIVEASQSVQVSGAGIIGTDPANQVNSALFTQSEGSGQAGDLQIETGSLGVSQGGEITVSGTDTGNAGQLRVNAGQILLEDGSLQGETQAGGQGDLVLNAGAIQLRQGSRISTDAAGEATGGNITITADTLIGLENSDISANALGGPGGRIEITASGVFGLQVITRQELEPLVGQDLSNFDPGQLPTNDILAISQTDPNLNGEVIFNSPDVDPSSQLVLVSEALVDVADLVATTCNPGAIGSRFLILGRGGLAATPIDLQQRSSLWLDLRPLEVEPVEIGADPEPIVGEPGVELERLQASLVIACRE